MIVLPHICSYTHSEFIKDCEIIQDQNRSHFRNFLLCFLLSDRSSLGLPAFGSDDLLLKRYSFIKGHYLVIPTSVCTCTHLTSFSARTARHQQLLPADSSLLFLPAAKSMLVFNLSFPRPQPPDYTAFHFEFLNICSLCPFSLTRG